VESEVELAFSGLQQLLAPIMSRLDALPADQASAVLGTHSVVAEPTTDYLVSAGALALLTCAAAERPVLVVVDDAQYLDRTSMGALTFAARRVSNAGVALLFGVRCVDRHALNRAGLPEIRLDGLTPDAGANLLADHGWTAPPAVCAAVVAATGGNPLALAELARARPAQVDEALLQGTVPLGTQLREWFSARLDRLPAPSRDLLVIAATEETGSLATVLAAAERLGLPASALSAAEGEGSSTSAGARCASAIR
jgi:hypothetical protein